MGKVLSFKDIAPLVSAVSSCCLNICLLTASSAGALQPRIILFRVSAWLFSSCSRAPARLDREVNLAAIRRLLIAGCRLFQGLLQTLRPASPKCVARAHRDILQLGIQWQRYAAQGAPAGHASCDLRHPLSEKAPRSWLSRLGESIFDDAPPTFPAKGRRPLPGNRPQTNSCKPPQAGQAPLFLSQEGSLLGPRE